MILYNLDTLSDGIKGVRIDGERIAGVYSGDQGSANKDEISIRFENCIAFPGLINSHDHPDFNLFPQLGNRHLKTIWIG